MLRLSERVTLAIHLALYQHKDQEKKFTGLPYIVHPIRVAISVAMLPGVTEDMIIAAILHDVLEDGDVTMTKELIEDKFGASVAKIVWELTNQVHAGPRKERKALEAQRLRFAGEEAKRIKLCDRLDNVSDLAGEHVARDFALMYAEESRYLVEQIGASEQEVAREILSEIVKVG